MKQSQKHPNPPAFDKRRKFTHEFTTHTSEGNPVTVRYRRVPIRDGYDIEAEIIAKKPRRDDEEREL